MARRTRSGVALLVATFVIAAAVLAVVFSTVLRRLETGPNAHGLETIRRDVPVHGASSA